MLTNNKQVLKGTLFPQAQIRECIVHQIRYSLNFVPWKERKAVAHNLKAIYKVDNEGQVLQALEAFKEKWDAKYPSISASWERNREKIIPFLSYPPAVRKVMYTTNAIESLNMALRKIIKNRGRFPSQEADCKLLFLVSSFFFIR
ncbi:MAG: transposase [Caedimonas sp.]|nr:transposase [Caedimonas sp.]